MIFSEEGELLSVGDVSSDSDSEVDIPKYEIPAFKKYPSKIDEPSQPKKSDLFHNKSIKLASSLNPGLDCSKGNYLNVDLANESLKDQVKREKKNLQKILAANLKKSIVCQPDFESLEKVPTYLSRRQKTKQGLKEKEKTKGFHWYNMRASEMTEEKKNDLLVLQMRQALDPKHFYKRSANKPNSKYFEIGTFVESPVDFYSSRVPKKQRKQTLVDELLADAEFRRYQKKKITEIELSQPRKFIRRKKGKKTKFLDAVGSDTKKKNKK
ncbi:Deoxynucleotidyltransferase terminal-interacting protein 2, partial [Stegodyphus mimosarum]